MNENLKVEIFDNINDPILKDGWLNLQHETEVFPQMYYEWVAPWWKKNNKGRKLYVITILNKNKNIIGIAPFCLERKFGMKVLQNIPIHFGDYYAFIVQNNDSQIMALINEHIISFRKWSYTKIDLVRVSTPLYNSLGKSKYHQQHVENVIEAKFPDVTFEEYLMLLNRKVRGEFRRRLRKLNELGNICFKVSSDFEDYLNFEDDFKRIYELRWQDVDKNLPSDKIYTYRRDALEGLNIKKKAVFVLLMLDNELIAYRFGIIHNNRYHDYKISFNPKYHRLGLGSIMTGLLIDDLIDQGVTALDHGVGDYSYKEDWSPEQKKTKVITFHKHNINPLSIAYFKFTTDYKSRLKKLLKK